MRSKIFDSIFFDSISLALLLLSLLLAGAKCGGGGGGSPLSPAPGMPQYQELAFVAVPGGQVNAAGGNFTTSRTDLDLDTRLGRHTVGATYNSKSGSWLWSFDVTYDGTTFVDYTGAVHDLSAVSGGEAVPGTFWVKGSASHKLWTKGGLKHVFDESTGRLKWIGWRSSAYPRIRFVHQGISGEDRTVAIEQCNTSTAPCTGLFDIDYDGSGRLIRITDHTGRMAEFSYDSEGRLEAARDALDLDEGWPGFRYEYLGVTRRLTAIVNSEGERIEIDYKGSRVERVRPVGPPNPVYRFAYTRKIGALYSTTYTDPVGSTTIYRYDDLRRVHAVEHVAVGETSEYLWIGNELRPARRTRPAGLDGQGSPVFAVTEWTYVDDDVATELQPSGNLLTYTHEPDGVNRDAPRARPVSTITDSLGALESRTYDVDGRLTSVANGAGETTTFDYDAEEMLEWVLLPSFPNDSLKYQDYGDHGNADTVSRILKTDVRVHDAVGNLTKSQAIDGTTGPGLGGVVSRGFDADRNPAVLELSNQRQDSEDLETATLTIDRGSDGRLTGIVRPFGGDTEYVYDSLGRRIEQRERASGVGHDGWQSTPYAYDAAGRLLSRERPNGMREELTYDARGRIANRRILKDGAVEATAGYTYAHGALSTIQDSSYGSAAEERYFYDAAGRPSLVVYPGGEARFIAYDLRSRITGVSFVDSQAQLVLSFAYAYDAADREVEVRESGSLILRRTYQGGRLVLIEYGNGLERAITYDEQLTGFIETTKTRFANGGALVEDTEIDVLFSCGGRACVHLWTQTFGALVRTTEEHHSLGQPGAEDGIRIFRYSSTENASSRYEFDVLSNLERIEEPRCSDGSVGTSDRTLSYNPERNRLLSVDDPDCGISHTYAYDASGFVVARGGEVIDWDGAGRIRAIGGDASFVWDTQGRPVSRTILGAETRYLFGGEVEADPTGVPTRFEASEFSLDLAEGERRYRHHDFRGNVKFVTDDAGSVIRHHHYGPFGVIDSYGSEAEPFSFAQGRAIGDLVLLGHRPLEAVSGAFLAPDPLYQVLNQHSYTHGNPVWYWDPDGRVQTSPGDMGKGGISGSSLGRINRFANGLPPNLDTGAGAALGMAKALLDGMEASARAEARQAALNGFSGAPKSTIGGPGWGVGGIGRSHYNRLHPGLPIGKATSLDGACAGLTVAGYTHGGLAPIGAFPPAPASPERLLLIFVPLAVALGWRVRREGRARRR